MSHFLTVLMLLFGASITHAKITKLDVKYSGDLIRSESINLNFSVLLSNGDSKRFTRTYEDFAFDDYWPYHALTVRSKQGQFRGGKFMLSRQNIERNDHKIVLDVIVSKGFNYYRDTLVIDVPKLLSYDVQSDSLQPYHYSSYKFLLHYSDGRTLVHSKDKPVHAIKHKTILLSKDPSIEMGQGELRYVPQDGEQRPYVILNSRFSDSSMFSTDTLHLYKKQILNLFFDGYDGRDGAHGDQYSNGHAGDHGKDGPNVELLIRRKGAGLEVLLFYDTLLYQYHASPNSTINLYVRGGMGGAGGHGDYLTKGGQGGNGGKGGVISVYSDLSLMELSRMLNCNVEGGLGAYSGAGYFLAGGKGVRQEKGKDGDQGEIRLIVVSPEVLAEMFKPYDQE